MSVIILDYGSGNIASVQNALHRIGVPSQLSDSPEIIKTATRIIFPGVAEASLTMRTLKEKKLDGLLPYLTQPVLGICLGMQLLCSSTEENDTKGFDVFPLEIKEIRGQGKTPHMGWNTLQEMSSPLFKGIEKNAHVYFVHSFYCPINTYSIANTTYKNTFSAAIQNKNFYGVQFHPEKSAGVGEAILKNFMEI